MAEGGQNDTTPLLSEPEGVSSLSGMSQALENYSASAPNADGTPPDFSGMVLSPGGYSYGTRSGRGGGGGARKKTGNLRQARGTGRVPHSVVRQGPPKSPNKKSYSQLVREAETTPGAEIRLVSSSEAIARSHEERIRLKYYNRCREMVRNHHQAERRRNQTISEDAEAGETTPLLPHSSINHDHHEDDFLQYPMHLLPASFFQLHVPGHVQRPDVSQSSLITICALWNTMMGTSLLAVAWAIKQAGLAMGLASILFMTIVAGYTALSVLHTHKKHNTPQKPIPEFAQLCGHLLGDKMEYVAAIFSLLAVIGAAIVYWVLMSNFLLNTVVFIHDVCTGTSHSINGTDGNVWDVYCPNNLGQANNLTSFDYEKPAEPTFFDRVFNAKTAPVYLIVLLPIVSLKSPTFFTKFNAVGTLNVLYLLGLVSFLAAKWGVNADFYDTTSLMYVPNYKETFWALTGMMALGLFIHNAIITIMKNNRDQSKNARDVAIAFSMVSSTYSYIGVLFYLTFPMPKECIEDNILNNFAIGNKLMVATRLLLLLQLFTVFPLIMFIMRVQVFSLISRREHASYKKIYALNAIVLIICTLFAIFMPKIGSVIRFSGALCGCAVVFVLPLLCEMASLRLENKLKIQVIVLHSCIMFISVVNVVAQFCI